MSIFNKDGEFMSFVTNTKMVIGTFAILLSSIVGTYNITTSVFLTKAEAKEIYTKHLNQLDSQTSYNKLFILGQKLDRLHSKGDKEALTPSEARRKKDLENDYKSVSEHIKHLENKKYNDNIVK